MDVETFKAEDAQLKAEIAQLKSLRPMEGEPPVMGSSVNVEGRRGSVSSSSATPVLTLLLTPTSLRSRGSLRVDT